MAEIKLNEFKCIDCDQIFLMTNKQAVHCPRCGSSGIQFGAVVTASIQDTELNK